MDGGDLLRMGLTLALLLAVPGALLWFLRRAGVTLPGAALGTQRLRVVARTSLDQKHSVILLRRDAQEHLLLIGPSGPTVLEAGITLSPEDLADQQRHGEEAEQRTAAARAAAANARMHMERLFRRGTDRFAAGAKRGLHPQPSAFAALIDSSAPKAKRRPRKIAAKA